MGLDKVDDVLASGAEVLTAGDTSCLMHIGGLLSRRGSPVRVMHLAEILAVDRGRRMTVTGGRTAAPSRTAATGHEPTFPGTPPFPEAARAALADEQLRANLGRATTTIRTKRAAAVAERADWEDLRLAGAAIKDEVLRDLPALLEQLEARRHRGRRHRPLGARRRRGERDRRRRSPTSTARPRSSRSSRWRPRRSSSTRRSARRASTSGRPTSPR